MDKNKHARNSRDQNGIDESCTNDVLTQIIQLKNEMRMNVGDVLGQMNQMRVEMRGTVGDLQSQLNMVRTDIKKFSNDVQNLPQQLTQNKTDISDTTAKLLEENHRLRSENEQLRQLLQRDPSAVMAAYPAEMYAHHQMQMAIYNGSENNCLVEEENKLPSEEALEIEQTPQRTQRRRKADGYAGGSKKIKNTEENITAESYMVKIGQHVEIPAEIYDTFKDEPRLPYLRKLLELVFGREVLATHTLGGRLDRPALNEDFINDIISHTAQKFKVDQTVIKKSISDRCFSERKRFEKQNTSS